MDGRFDGRAGVPATNRLAPNHQHALPYARRLAPRRVPVAQRIEHPPSKRQVVGSSPTGDATFITGPFGGRHLALATRFPNSSAAAMASR